MRSGWIKILVAVAVGAVLVTGPARAADDKPAAGKPGEQQKAGGATGFLLRPPWERPVISASETRWAVLPEAPSRADERRARWRLELLRCKGASLSAQGSWVVELSSEVGREALRVPPDVVGGSGEKAYVQGGAPGRSRIA